MKFLKTVYRSVCTYQGFRLLLLISLVLALVLLALRAHNGGALPSLVVLLSHEWRVYIIKYWLSHLGLAAFLLCGFVLIFVMHALRDLFHHFVAPFPPHPADQRLRITLRRLCYLCTIIFICLSIIIFPVIHLLLPHWFKLMPVILGIGAVFLTYWAFILPPTPTEADKKLSRYRFRQRRGFDIASLGETAEEARAELQRFRQTCSPPLSERAIEYLCDGHPTSLWPGYQRFFANLSRLLGVEPQRVTLHTTTTKAIRHILALVRKKAEHLVTTDIEFPSVGEAAKEIFTDQNLHIVKIRQQMLQGKIAKEAIIRLITSEADKISNNNQPVCIMVSHVNYITGGVIDIVSLSKHLKQNCTNDHILIVDGAQAVANVEVTPSILNSCDFYAASGHKWLLGHPTLGITVHSNDSLDNAGIHRNELCEPSRPFSTYEFDVRVDYTKETLFLEPMISLSAMLSDLHEAGMHSIARHNQVLAELFVKWVGMGRVQHLEILSYPVLSGIVCARCIAVNARDVKASLEQKYGITVQCLNEHLGTNLNDDLLRFCFHYHLKKRDVYDLVAALQDVIGNLSDKSGI